MLDYNEDESQVIQEVKVNQTQPVGNILNGVGYYIWADGTFYQGEWRYNERFGTGQYQWPDGSSYQGSWKNDVWFGQGTYTNKYGVQFKGLWHDNNLLPGQVHISGIKYQDNSLEVNLEGPKIIDALDVIERPEDF